MIDYSTYKRLLLEVEKLGKEYNALEKRYGDAGYVFEQIVSVNELVDIRIKLDSIQKTADEKLEHDSQEYLKICSGLMIISNKIDSAFYTKKYVSEK